MVRDRVMRPVRLLAVAVLAIILAASSFSPVAAISGFRILKVTTNGDTITVFHFTVSSETDMTGAADFDLVGGEYWDGGIAAGVYTVIEKVPSGWVLDVECVNLSGDNTFEYLPGRGVTITFAEGYVECTFTNSPAAVGGVVMPVNTFAVLAPWLAVIAVVGCVATVAIVVRKRRP